MIVIDKSIIIPSSNFFIEFIEKSKSKEITKKSKVDQLIECSSFSRLCIDDKFVFIDNKHFVFQKIIDKITTQLNPQKEYRNNFYRIQVPNKPYHNLFFS